MSDHEHKHDCGCGCEHDEEEFETVVLTDENGEEHEFVHLDTIELEGNTYFVLMPVLESEDEAEAEAESDDADEAIILKLGKDDEGNEILLDIEDDEEWEKVADAWDSLEEE